MKRFWNWIKDEGGGRVLRLEGPIDEENYWGDSITPKNFRKELEDGEGDLTVWLNSPGGSVFAAAEIYTMLRDYAGKVTVKIASIAASAATVVAMAGDKVLMSPTAMLFLHDPMTLAMGNTKDMEKAITTLNEVKESLINAYQAKTGLTRAKISKLMDNETWLNAKKAVELGFADEILFEDKKSQGTGEDEVTEDTGDTKESKEESSGEDQDKKSEEDFEGKPGHDDKEDAKAWIEEAKLFSSKQMGQTILNKLGCGVAEKRTAPVASDRVTDANSGIVIGMDGKTEDGSVPYEILKKSLEYLV